jgi:hypothetical protein
LLPEAIPTSDFKVSFREGSTYTSEVTENHLIESSMDTAVYPMTWDVEEVEFQSDAE